MEIGNIIPHIEALIFASDKPLTSMEITELINNAFGFMEEKLTLEQIQTSIEGILEKYATEFYPFEVRESGGGWQFLTKKDFHKTIAQLNGEKFLKRLSSAALETLSIVAYKQPITKGEIEAIRGVSSDYSIQKLLEKELVIISGRNEDMPGKPLVYTTSKSFMDYFGINSPTDLPKLKEIFVETLVEPTQITNNLIHSADAEETDEPTPSDESTISGEPAISDEDSVLVVSEEGELNVSGEPNPDASESAAPAASKSAAHDAPEPESDAANEGGHVGGNADEGIHPEGGDGEGSLPESGDGEGSLPESDDDEGHPEDDADDTDSEPTGKF